jgi:hypothetical protein
MNIWDMHSASLFDTNKAWTREYRVAGKDISIVHSSNGSSNLYWIMRGGRMLYEATSLLASIRWADKYIWEHGL